MINEFEIDEKASLEDNLHNYYNEIINHWLKNPNEIITIAQITKTTQIHFTNEGRLSLTDYKNNWSNCVTDKFLEIIKAKNIKMRVNAAVVKQMFLSFSNDLINALKSGNYRLAKEKKQSLLRNYDIIIDTFLNGIVQKEYL